MKSEAEEGGRQLEVAESKVKFAAQVRQLLACGPVQVEQPMKQRPQYRALELALLRKYPELQTH